MQHILTVLQETARDADYVASLEERCNSPSTRFALNAAAATWTEHGPITPLLRIALLHSMSGPGHLWVLDNGNRRCSKSLPMPRSVVHSLQDAPLSDEHLCIALRMRMQLPLGKFHTMLRTKSGQKRGPIQCNCSKNCTKHRRCFDSYGLHLATMAQGNWSMMTDRHHRIAELILSNINAAGFRAVREKSIFHGTLETGTEDSTPEHYCRMRMDLIGAIPESFLVKIGAVARRSTDTRALPLHHEVLWATLLDLSFIHPGPHLLRLFQLSNTPVFDPVAPGTLRDGEKLAKYNEPTNERKRRAVISHALATWATEVNADSVFLPLSFSTYGRLYPSAEKFLEGILSLASTRGAHASEPDARDSMRSRFKRFSLFRALSSTVMRSTITGMINATGAARSPGYAPPSPNSSDSQQSNPSAVLPPRTSRAARPPPSRDPPATTTAAAATAAAVTTGAATASSSADFCDRLSTARDPPQHDDLSRLSLSSFLSALSGSQDFSLSIFQSAMSSAASDSVGPTATYAGDPFDLSGSSDRSSESAVAPIRPNPVGS